MKFVARGRTGLHRSGGAAGSIFGHWENLVAPGRVGGLLRGSDVVLELAEV